MPKKNSSENSVMHYSSWQLMRDILHLLKPHKWRFFLASGIRLLGDIVWLYPPFAFAQIITFLTTYTPGTSLSPLWLIVLLWSLATILRAVSQFFAKYLGFQVAEKLALDTTLNTMNHLFLLDMVWHERENSGNKIKKIQNAGGGVNIIIRLWFNNIIEIGVNLIAINIIIAQFDRLVFFILLFFLCTYFLISHILTKKAGIASYTVNAQEEVVNGQLFEAINNIRTVKAMAVAKTLYTIIIGQLDDLFKKLRARIFWYQSRNVFLSFWETGFKLSIIIIIIYGIINGRYEIGFLILFNSYFSDLRGSIDELATASVDFMTSKFSIARLKDVLNEPITIDSDAGKMPFSPNWKTISFRNVSFAYEDQQVLHDISFTVQRGDKVGIVGLSGSGKSTLFRLLLKEREEFTGDVLFDDVSIKKIRKSDYFKQVSVVLQDTEVFNISLRDNITITNVAKKNDEALLNQALTTAHIADFLKKLPAGLDTMVGEKGVRLSGGERQRLGIARAIFRAPQLLLMDEATSHLDLDSEEKIRDSLHTFFENVTAIVIAHRLTTIKEMDKILVLEHGKLIECGNFAELYARKGRFYELWEKQKL